nr:hypothetical protein [Modestobacter excelsi]
MGVHQGGQVVAAERPGVGEALVQQAGQRVDVGPRVDRQVGEPLRGHVVQRPDGRPAHRQSRAGRADLARDAEVDDVDEVARGDQHVGRLDVAVHQTVGVRSGERLGDLADQVDRPRRGQRTGPLQQPADVLAVDQPHVDEQPAVDLPEVVDRDDVRLAQAGGDQLLAAEPGQVLRVVGVQVGQQLERHQPSAPGVTRAVDVAHAAAAQQVQQLVRPEHPRRHAVSPSSAHPPSRCSRRGVPAAAGRA